MCEQSRINMIALPVNYIKVHVHFLAVALNILFGQKNRSAQNHGTAGTLVQVYAKTARTGRPTRFARPSAETRHRFLCQTPPRIA